MFNEEGECGTGAVVPWADRLWVVTYAPHKPTGSSDKLYEVTSDLRQIIRSESVGGTPANRFIHRESQQLFIGPYAIDAQANVRTIPYSRMFGRPTGNARHLTNPSGKIYYATMEEGIYEVDVQTLEVEEVWADEQRNQGRHANLPGYHGKGLYAGQGVLIYANNGEHGDDALRRPDIPSGVLAEWDGNDDKWNVVRRNQFTEVTGPGGLFGNDRDDDPVWSIGWDHRSLILMCRDNGKWHAFRLPKASHSYDGAHGWNTEWPRIREIGEDDLLMTMHGMFWRFPRSFRSSQSSGILPRSTYLKVIGDFCRWNDQIVFGCDDTARNEFLNKRKAKGEIAAPQSQSNLWFVDPDKLDTFGPAFGRGAVWLEDDVAAATPSEPFLMSGFMRRGLHLAHATNYTVTIALEYDEQGNGDWRKRRTIELPPGQSTWIDLSDDAPAIWVRLASDQNMVRATAWFTCSNPDRRTSEADAIFAGLMSTELATEGRATGGIVRPRGDNQRTLHFVAGESSDRGPRELGLYELDDKLRLRHVSDSISLEFERKHGAIRQGVITADAASAIFVDEQDRRWRLPRGMKEAELDGPLGASRCCREVATERDLFNAAGTFFELPAENAGGFARVRAVATHNRRIIDYCSYRGLLVMSGLQSNPPRDNPHVVISDDKRTALWIGSIDDVWRIGKPRGLGGPWRDTVVQANVPSEPYLMTGYDRKRITLSHAAGRTINMRVECDITGTGLWLPYQDFAVAAHQVMTHEFPAAYSAYWLRVVADADCTATAQLRYE